MNCRIYFIYIYISKSYKKYSWSLSCSLDRHMISGNERYGSNICKKNWMRQKWTGSMWMIELYTKLYFIHIFFICQLWSSYNGLWNIYVHECSLHHFWITFLHRWYIHLVESFEQFVSSWHVTMAWILTIIVVVVIIILVTIGSCSESLYPSCYRSWNKRKDKFGYRTR